MIVKRPRAARSGVISGKHLANMKGQNGLKSPRSD
jgi:hypothetical protein